MNNRLCLVGGWSLILVGFVIGTWLGLDILYLAYLEYLAGHILEAGVYTTVYAGLFTALGMALFMIPGAALLSFVVKLPPPKLDTTILPASQDTTSPT